MAAKHTPGPWTAFNMVHAERGDAMTPDEIGEYVANSVRKTIEDGGATDRFLFVTAQADEGPDICHVGNGPAGPANARLIASAPALLEALKEVHGACLYAEDDGVIGVTSEPTIDSDLFDRICAAIRQAEGGE